MTTIIKGDIKDIIDKLIGESKDTTFVLMHGCNCMNNMGAGLAKTIAWKWSAADVKDKQTTKGDRAKLGTYTSVNISNRLIIANVYSQYAYGHGLHCDYAALQDGLLAVKRDMSANIDDVAFVIPEYIGCGLAGGDIDIVKPMIDGIFKDTKYYLFDK